MTWRSIDDDPPLPGALILLKHPEASRPEEVRLINRSGQILDPFDRDPGDFHNTDDHEAPGWTWRTLMPTMDELNDWWLEEFPKLVALDQAHSPRPVLDVWSLFTMMERAGIGLSRVQLSVTGKTFDVWRSQAARTEFERDRAVCVASWNAGADRSDSRYRRAIALPELTP